MQKYRVSWTLRLRRSLLRVVFRQIFRVLYRIRILGVENIPPSGPYLVAYNHVSIVDPAFILAFWPVAAETVGAAALWHRRGQNIIVRMYGTIPVHRGAIDRALIEKAVAVLEAGLPLSIAPEGQRSHVPGMQRAHPGIAYLVDQVRAPVLPVGVVGNSDEMLARALRGARPKLEMRIGKPFHLPPITGRGRERREARQRNADLVMQHIAALLPAEYQGVYAVNRFPQSAQTG